jgi:hypothetical protein
MAWSGTHLVPDTSRLCPVWVSSIRCSAAVSTNASPTGSTAGGLTEQELRGGVGDDGVIERWFNRR